MVSTEGACETCKKVGVVAKCMYGTGAACVQCKLAKLHCSLVQGQRKPTEAAGSSAVAAVIVKTTKSKLALSVFPSLTHQFDR